MFGQKVQDLHGHTFEFDGKFECYDSFPTSKITGKLSFNNDRITNTSFCLIQMGLENYAFVLYENSIHKYGVFTYVSYDPKKDFRHKKELH